MAQQNLRTFVTIGGRVDNSFGRIGDSLTVLGSQIEGISRKIIDLGKESVKEYVDYDDAMRSVQALGEYGNATMKALDDYNKSVAKSSKWTMEQLANAETLIAQLGLPLEDMYTLMPAVMNVATSAGIEMADSLDYLYYTLVALDQPMSYATTLGDQMAKAAAISSADVDTLGQSLQRLGSASQFFAGGSSELLAILSGISQFGADMQGSSAGTQLRNFMLTLLAPTKSKATIMETFGVSEEQWAEFEAYMEDAEINVTDTAAAMNELGLSCYDASTGKLKPAIQIIGELNAALATMSEEERNATLGQLFGKRTTVTAMNLLAALPTIIDYWNQIENESAGYAKYTADTKEGGLGGMLRELASGWDALKTTFGETISPEVEAVAGFLHGIVTDIASMDEENMAMLAGGLAGIATVGPGLLLAGGAFKLMGTLATPVGATAFAVALLAAAGGAAYGYFSRLSEIDLKESFGDMELDAETLKAHLKTIEDSFKETYKQVDKYNTALTKAVESYQAASSTLSGELLTTMITGATLTEAQIKEIEGLGTSMEKALRSGITNSMAGSMSYLELLFGGDKINNPEYANAILLGTDVYNSLLDEATKLGDDFGTALGNAMDDGIITGDEYSVIMEKMRAYNEAMAFAAEAERQGELAVQLHKAGGVSLDSASGFLESQAEQYRATLAEKELEYIRERAKLKAYYDEGINRGTHTKEDRDLFLSEFDQAYLDSLAQYKEDHGDVVMGVFEGLMAGSDYAAAWPFLKTVLANIDKMERDGFGALTLNDINWEDLEASGELTEGMSSFLAELAKDAGGLQEIFEPFKDIPEVARFLEMIQYASALSGGAEMYYLRKEGFLSSGGTVDPFNEFATQAEIERNIRRLQLQNDLADLQAQETEINKEIAERENRLAGNDRPLFYNLTGGEQADWNMLHGNVLGGNLYERKDEVEASLQALQAELQALGGVEIEASLIGLAEATQEAQEYLNNNPGTWNVEVKHQNSGKPHFDPALATYAEGGRATEASIFGEAGAEWAIPEEHTANTASLLWRAAKASGFSWQDIAAANGQGASSSRSGNTLVYSPTIIAADATGVEEKLREDKDRLERWLKERELKDSIAVYA